MPDVSATLTESKPGQRASWLTLHYERVYVRFGVVERTTMTETIVTFQSQLSGVMETVFKAAMYEITRLVEDSFLEEVTRCREQVESLKRRLKWSESRREGDSRGRCAECGRIELSGEERARSTGQSVLLIVFNLACD